MYPGNEDDSRIYRVVINQEKQYSIWLEHKEIPVGWEYAGFSGNKQHCLDYVRANWHDMRSLSLRKFADGQK